MRILFVSNSASNSGAPRMLATCREAIRAFRSVTDDLVIAPFDGYARADVSKVDLFNDVALGRKEREDLATTIIASYKPDVVFVNTLRVAYFLPSAKRLGLRTVAYVHEMGNSLIELVTAGFAPLDFHAYADQIFWAADGCRRDWNQLSGSGLIGDVLTPCVSRCDLVPHENDSKKVEQLRNLVQKYPFYVASIGTVCHRKGFDRFLELAKSFPSLPFVWIGDFDKNDPADRTGHRAAAKSVKNLLVTGSLADPWSVIQGRPLVLFLSREDPNPLTILEAEHFGVNYLACLDGLGDSSVPIEAGRGIAQYDREVVAKLISSLAAGDEQAKAKYLPVKTEKQFSEELISKLVVI